MVGRQEAQAVERSGVRLSLLRQQAEAGDIDLLYLDESEVLTHPYLARCWAPRGTDLRIPAPGQANMSMSTTQLAERYGCLSMTLEMPFKDNFDLPDPLYGWSPERSKFLAHHCLGALHAILSDLKA